MSLPNGVKLMRRCNDRVETKILLTGKVGIVLRGVVYVLFSLALAGPSSCLDVCGSMGVTNYSLYEGLRANPMMLPSEGR